MQHAAHANRLIHETSPYLLQHAHNPVDWYPWGDEAFARARAENMPIFLSIGYAACHWCHVMERESFENRAIADVLNRYYVAIKVDREERPDLDALYMQAVQILSGTGGWPMSVFLTPAGEPFFGGTYYPPRSRLGRPGFDDILLRIHEIWERDGDGILASGREVIAALNRIARRTAGGEGSLSPELLDRAVAELAGRYDPVYGGFGEAPRFPAPMALALLLRRHARTGDARALEMAASTLKKMARGGIYDQIGGGFHRYATDHAWLVPHFEKMLTDNALLAPVYFDAHAVTGDPFFLRIGRETLDYVLRELSDLDGGFCASQDADSAEGEGRYYLWTPGQLENALGRVDGALFADYYGVTPQGNWAEGEGGSILNVRLPLEDYASLRNLNPRFLASRLDALRARLLELRGRRAAPARDDKVLAGWNGLAISALARGAQVAGDDRYARAATRAAQFVLAKMRGDGGGLRRSWRAGQARVGAFLEDHAALIGGLLDLYETTFDPALVREADGLARALIERFGDPAGAGFYTADGRDPAAPARLKDYYDGAVPSGNALAALALARLGRLLDRPPYREAARAVLASLADQMAAIPAAHHQALCALDFELAAPPEVAVIGDPAADSTRVLVAAVWRRYLPNRLMAAAPPGRADGIAMLAGKTAAGGEPAVYVCRNYACGAPVHTPAEVEALLGQ
ncbi:MAG: thioredoxin domain-containing protein [bacterium]|nr:thioredoxin domain-containing protein [bacterium]